MDALLTCCAGLDVHKKNVTACVLTLGEDGRLAKQIRTFGTMRRQLLELGDWLGQAGVGQVAMESTGVLWKPIWNVLEGWFELMLVNARHLKGVPGRKTDVADSQWIAQLLQHGLLSPSLVPERPQRQLRDLTRHRAQLTGEKARQINRIHKVLEDANIKLGAVASDVMGVSGRAMLAALIEGQRDPRAIAELARRKLRGKIPQLVLALEGRVDDHHRFLLKLHYEHVQHLEGMIDALTIRIERLMGPPPDDARNPAPDMPPADPPDAPLSLEQAAELIDEAPGIDRRGAQDLLAEIGADMGRYPSAKHLRSWARQCPGNRESAGKRKSGKTGAGNRWLRRVLGQMAWAASHAKDTYLATLYRRLARRRGKKRAIVAVGHSILVIVYHMLKHQRHFKELGGCISRIREMVLQESHTYRRNWLIILGLRTSRIFLSVPRRGSSRLLRRPKFVQSHKANNISNMDQIGGDNWPYNLADPRDAPELGADFFDQLNPVRVMHYHVGRLESFGYKVNLLKEPQTA